MLIQILQETFQDYDTVESVIEQAFKDAEHTDYTEHHLVNRLRKSEEFIPELSLIAKDNETIVGHALLTKCFIKNDSNSYEVLALAPVSILPSYQGKGIGTMLINKGIELAKSLGFSGIIVLGHEHYYPKFGFKRASLYNIKAPFDVPDSAFMALPLMENGLDDIHGVVNYSPAFFE